MRTTTMLRPIAALILAAVCTTVIAQNKYWIAAEGNWNDPANWSLMPEGAGGAGIPRVGENVFITPTGSTTIIVNDATWCADLIIDGSNGMVKLHGAAEMNIAGSWSMIGSVQWQHTGDKRLVARRGGFDLDLRGTLIHGNIVLDGQGSWSMLSDLTLTPKGALIFKRGTLIGNANTLKASEFRPMGNSPGRFIGGGGVVMLEKHPPQVLLDGHVQPGNSTLVVQGNVVPWNIGVDEAGGGDRDMNVCGTGPGQTPFIIDAQLISNYNGFGVSCRGVCNGVVTVTVEGGIGPFAYQWLNNGPPSATWSSACGGPQIVIVTDIGQGISCPASVNVTEPGPLGVIFFGQGTPPTCANVCDGTRTALAVGGVSPHSYNWNNGAGTNSSFFQLCAGLNTLQITDANNCTFDTTFYFNIQPIEPNLVFIETSCFGECDGSAEVSPTGGTGTYTFTWVPPPPSGQGTSSVSGLCAGDWSVTITDGNGCDTTVTFLIDEPPPITLDLQITDATCFGLCDGTAELIVGGAVGPFTFVWDPSPGTGQNTSSAGGLCAGTYTVLITDQATGCDTLISLDIDVPDPIDLQGQTTDATCADACDGSIVLAPVGGTPPFTYAWSPAPSAGQGTPAVSGLCAGEWTVTVTDAAGCDTTMVFNIEAPPPIEPGLVYTDLTCFGICDGTASAAVSGGVPPYSYLWTPAPPAGQGTSDVTGLCAGEYQLLITDSNGCDTLVTFEVIEPPVLEAIADHMDVSCDGICDGSASVEVNGGSPGYSYVWTPEPPSGQGTATATGLCPGSWEVLISDANGCELLVAFIIDDAAPLVVNLQTVPASCPGTCDGSAGVLVSGGTPGYTHNWSPEPGGGQGSPSATGLCPQEWSLTIMDALGCDTTIFFTIDAPEPILANAIVNDATCADLCNGSIQLVPTGGSGSYTYNWSPAPSTGQGTASVSGLCPGEWEVLITSGACDTTITFIIGAPPAIEADLAITDVTCPGECDGTVEAMVIGGTEPFTFLWTPAPATGQGTSVAGGLCAGEYSLLITDALGCDTVLVFLIADPEPLSADVQVTQASCGTACDGAATIVVDGGTAPYQYAWGPGIITGQGTDTATELCPGAYEVLVTDAVGCMETFMVLIDTPSGIEVDATVAGASCAGSCDGSISLVTSGSIGPYGYTWDPEPGAGQGTAQASGLCAGTWFVLVSDALGCDTLIAFEIEAPEPILPNETWTNESCNGPCDGTASVAPTGGVGPYTYLWTPAPPSGQGSSSVTGLCPGTWTVLITDAAGCDTTVVFEILDQLPIIAELISDDGLCADLCGGSASVTASGGVEPYTYVWTPEPGSGQGTPSVTGLCIGIWQVFIEDALGCDTTLTFAIEAPAPFVIDLVVIEENCTGPCTGGASITVSGGVEPYQILWAPEPIDGQGTTTVTGLCSGTIYSVLITDDNGCDTTLTFTVEPFTEIIPVLVTTDASCADACDGTVSASATGGVFPYTYQWSPEPATGQGTAQATGFCAGEVEVLITDAEGCSINASTLIMAPEPLMDNAVVTDVQCHDVCDGSIVVDPSGGVGPYDVYWSPVPGDGQGSLIASGLCMGTYLVQIVDANGCETIFSHDIIKPDPMELDIVITPNECLQCIGTASVSITGGVPDYDVVWIDPQGDVIGTGNFIDGLCAGVHSVQVTDLNGCSIALAVPIIDPDGEVLTPEHGVTSCPGSCDGAAGVSFTCSDPPCTIAWTDAQGQDLGESGSTVGMLCEGAYYASVTNASGCVSIQQVNVVPPDTLETEVTVTPVSCTGVCDGSATIGIVGGQFPFTITWDPPPAVGQGLPFASGLCEGEYTVSILDGSGCTTEVSVFIPGPAPLILDAVVIDVACSGICDGSIQPIVSGGTATYAYVWSPAIAMGGDGSVSGLCDGTYTLTVTDANGCSVTQSYAIVMPDLLQVTGTSTASNCPDCDGTATLDVIGGTGPFEYTWMYQGSVAGTTEVITGLCGGLYWATVTDANGCSATVSIIVPDNNAEVLTPVDGIVGCANDCTGSVSVEFVCTLPPCSTTWTNAQGDVIAQNVLQLDDLCVGDYTVEVTNGGGCTSVAVASVEPSQQIIPDLSFTPVSCPGECDGTATVEPTGGVEPYTYAWSPEPGSGQGTPTAGGLCAGEYDVLISDASGCDTTITFTITDPQTIMVTATMDDLSCAADCDGSISVVVSGGASPFTYSWSPEPAIGQGSPTIEGLCAGVYSLSITDANGCVHMESWTLEAPEPLVLNTTSTPSECGDCSGGVNVTVSGGVGPYFFAWTLGGNVFGTGQQVNGLCAGLYTVLVIDSNGCEAMQLVPVSDVDGPILTMEDGETSCPGTCDGAVSVDFICTEPDCTVEWFDAMGVPIAQNDFTLEGLCAGTYYVQVTTGLGCVTIDAAVVVGPDPIDPNLSTTAPACAGACDGTATVAPTGGNGPYEFEWIPAPPIGQGTPEVSGLCAGEYMVIITDSLGCSITVPVVIEDPDFLSVSTMVTPITCNEACDGVISVDPSGGAPPYTIVWTPEPPGGQGVLEAVDLCAGTWQFSVIDDNGCVSNGTIQLLDPPHLEVELTATNSDCAGDCNGSAQVTIVGGTGSHTIVWEGPDGVIAQDVISVFGLCSGDHLVTISDANGCTETVPFFIDSPEPLVADLVFTGESCNGPCDGTASVTVTGGTGSYTFLWQPGPGSGQGTADVTGLCAGDHIVTITDAAGCDTTITFTVLPFMPFSVDAAVSDVACPGDCDGSIVLDVSGGAGVPSFQWTPEPGTGQGTSAAGALCAGEYSVLISDPQGCDATFTFTINTPQPLIIGVDDIQMASCNSAFDAAVSVSISGGTPVYDPQWSGPGGFTSSEEDLTGIAPGSYTLAVTDANGCTTMIEVEVGALAPVEADAGGDQQICAGVTVMLDGSLSTGGTTFLWTDASGIELADSAVTTVGPFQPGVYTFTLTVSEGICFETDEVTIVVLDGPLADAGPPQTIFVSGTATLGGSPTAPLGATIVWAPDSVLSNATVPNPIADPNETTWFTVTVTDENGCQSIDSVLITVLPEVVIPSGFTPNGDGWNDAWVIDLIDMFPQCEVEVYSRWGEQLFRSVGYQQPWDGRYNGGFVPVGTYYYVIKLNHPEFPEPYTGPLTVIH